MPDIASVLKTEISRLARKESRAETAALKKAATGHRSEIAELKRRVQALERELRGVLKATRPSAAPIAPRTADDGSERATRFSAKGLATLRKRLGLSADDFGRLIGASGQSVYNWEQGATRPRDDSIGRIAALRGLGKREVTRRLDALRGEPRV